jgi:hypothetical protein
VSSPDCYKAVSYICVRTLSVFQIIPSA